MTRQGSRVTNSYLLMIHFQIKLNWLWMKHTFSLNKIF
jgi:hypothetical protein